MTTKKHTVLSLAMLAALGAATLFVGSAAAERIENRASSIGQIIELEAARSMPGTKPASRQTAAVKDRGTTDAFTVGSGGHRSPDWRRSHFGFDGGR